MEGTDPERGMGVSPGKRGAGLGQRCGTPGGRVCSPEEAVKGAEQWRAPGEEGFSDLSGWKGLDGAEEATGVGKGAVSGGLEARLLKLGEPSNHLESPKHPREADLVVWGGSRHGDFLTAQALLRTWG